MNRFLSGILVALLIASNGLAQDVSISADVVSRYIWRGFDFGDGVSLQPGLSFTAGDFEVGSWASYELMGSGANEVDFYATYAIGDFSLGLTDYYFPSASDTSGKWGALDYSDGGAHTLELMAGFASEDLPFSALVAVNVFNDDDNSIYGELGFSAGEVDFALGAVAGESAYYGVDGFAIVNLSIGTSKDIKITDDFSLPMFGAFVLNPELERSHLYVGFSF